MDDQQIIVKLDEIEADLDDELAELKQTTVGYINKNWKPPPPAGSKWANALTHHDAAVIKVEDLKKSLAPAPPPVTFTVTQSVHDGQTISSPIAWTAQPSELTDKVDFYIDGSVKWTERIAPFYYNGDNKTFDPVEVAEGQHEFKVVATKADGTTATATAKVLTKKPVVPPTTPPPTTKTRPLMMPFTDGDGKDDALLNGALTNSSQQQWVKDHWARPILYLVKWPYITPVSTKYIDSIAIYTNQSNIDWSMVLKDSVTGKPLYINWGCQGGTCPQWAADPGNQKWRDIILQRAKDVMAQGFAGPYFDDVNLNFSFSDGSQGNRTPAGYTQDAYKNAFCGMLEYVRNALPNAYIAHNSVWFHSPNHDGKDAYTQRQINSANIVVLERGINDSGLTGGTGEWSIHRMFAYCDTVHSLGKNVLWLGYASDMAGAEANIAAAWMVYADGDYHSSKARYPTNWCPQFDLDLGEAKGPRTYSGGIHRREFTKGYVTLTDQRVGKVVKTG